MPEMSTQKAFAQGKIIINSLNINTLQKRRILTTTIHALFQWCVQYMEIKMKKTYFSQPPYGDEGVYTNDLELARTLGLDQSLVARTMRLTRLSPRDRTSHRGRRLPPSMTCASLRKPIPLDLREQERLLLGRD